MRERERRLAGRAEDVSASPNGVRCTAGHFAMKAVALFCCDGSMHWQIFSVCLCENSQRQQGSASRFTTECALLCNVGSLSTSDHTCHRAAFPWWALRPCNHGQPQPTVSWLNNDYLEIEKGFRWETPRCVVSLGVPLIGNKYKCKCSDSFNCKQKIIRMLKFLQL